MVLNVSTDAIVALSVFREHGGIDNGDTASIAGLEQRDLPAEKSCFVYVGSFVCLIYLALTGTR